MLLSLGSWCFTSKGTKNSRKIHIGHEFNEERLYKCGGSLLRTNSILIDFVSVLIDNDNI